MSVTRNGLHGKKKKGQGRWPRDKWTITKAADRLRVTRPHLSQVVHHHRQSRSLLKRYRQLLKTSPA